MTTSKEPTIRLHFPADYLGECSRCLSAEATTTIFEEFDTPILGGKVWTEDKGEIEIPDITGLRVSVCATCLRDDDQKDES